MDHIIEEIRKLEENWKRYINGEIEGDVLIRNVQQGLERHPHPEFSTPTLEYLWKRASCIKDGKIKGKPAKLLKCAYLPKIFKDVVDSLREHVELENTNTKLFYMLMNDLKRLSMCFVHASNEIAKREKISKEDEKTLKYNSSKIAITAKKLEMSAKKPFKKNEFLKRLEKIEDIYKTLSYFNFPYNSIQFRTKTIGNTPKTRKELKKSIETYVPEDSEIAAIISGGIEPTIYIAIWKDRDDFWSTEYSRKRLKQKNVDLTKGDEEFFSNYTSYLLGEDWISSGNTVLNLAKKIRQYNPKADIYVAALKAKKEGIELLKKHEITPIYGFLRRS